MRAGNDVVGHRWLEGPEQGAWRELIALLLRLPAALERQLREDAGLTHVEYLVLALLSEADGRRTRLSSLAGRANTSLSRLSHVVTRLERRGWLRREPDPDDARATVAVLTTSGWEKVVAAAPGHVDLVRRVVFEGLPPDQVEALRELSAHVVARLDPGRGPLVARQERPRTAAAEPISDRQVEVEVSSRAPIGSSRSAGARGTRGPSVDPAIRSAEPDREVEVEGRDKGEVEGPDVWSQPTLTDVGSPEAGG